ncbi:hypothetical protein DYY67_2294 [Candidatus Nitrosotalea sp. TS]|nr:hypothetical protein [Candidatus Nitrosotalea sp. TS]
MFSEVMRNELRSAILELALDGLCYVEPKILDKKEGAYVAA